MTASDDRALRALVGGVLWPGFLGRTVPDWLRREFDEGLAGAVLFAHNLHPDGRAVDRVGAPAPYRDLAPDEGGRVSRPGDAVFEGLDTAASRPTRPAFTEFDRPLLVGIDEEGGNVTRVDAAEGSTLPGAAQLGYLDDVAVTEAVGQRLAERSLAVGANAVLGPVADVNTDPRNPVIGVRSFGETPELVRRHAVAALRGIQSAGAAACVKHFPGHGDTHLDSHHAAPALTIELDELERVHLPPFRAAVEAGVAMVMTAHIIVPAWGEAPATLNPVALGHLRAMGFEGVIVTDALDMAAVRETVGAGPGAVQALLAGADLLCISNPTNLGAAAARDQDERDFREVQQAIFDALDDGTLPVEVLERAATRVRTLAESVGRSAVDERMPLDASLVARGAITVDGAVPAQPTPRTVLDVRGRSTLAVDSDRDYVETTLAAGGTVLRGDAAVPGSGALVVLVDAVGAPGPQLDRVANIARIRPDAVIVNAGMPSAGPAARDAARARREPARRRGRERAARLGSARMIVLSLQSGTSADGIDVAVVEIVPVGRVAERIETTHTQGLDTRPPSSDARSRYGAGAPTRSGARPTTADRAARRDRRLGARSARADPRGRGGRRPRRGRPHKAHHAPGPGVRRGRGTGHP